MASTAPPVRIRTISEFHDRRGLPKPEHPLISVINFNDVPPAPADGTSWVLDFYSLAMKRGLSGKVKYGQQSYDFDEGVLFCISPNQVFSFEARQSPAAKLSGWMLLVHPDFLWNTALAAQMHQYAFFDYAANEALFLSDKEEAIMHRLMQDILQEYRSNMDKFSQRIIVAQLETLLNYTDRFYQRQFLTRKISNHQLLLRLEQLLDAHFGDPERSAGGLPAVQSVADALHVSPNYLSSVLKVHTGQSTQQHIHHKLIEKAQEQLSTTNLSVSEIAYALGFEHPQSFSKLFKSRTNLAPLAFRKSFRN
jgi:AraC family transcriptional activator of pobA